jgi:hypothetical protein
LIACLRFGTTRPPDFAVDIQHSDFTRRFGTRAAADARGAINEGEFMVLLQEDDHAIRQLNAFGLLRMECGQWRNRDLLPIAGLGRGSRYWAKEKHNCNENE